MFLCTQTQRFILILCWIDFHRNSMNSRGFRFSSYFLLSEQCTCTHLWFYYDFKFCFLFYFWWFIFKTNKTKQQIDELNCCSQYLKFVERECNVIKWIEIKINVNASFIRSYFTYCMSVVFVCVGFPLFMIDVFVEEPIHFVSVGNIAFDET